MHADWSARQESIDLASSLHSPFRFFSLNTFFLFSLLVHFSDSAVIIYSPAQGFWHQEVTKMGAITKTAITMYFNQICGIINSRTFCKIKEKLIKKRTNNALSNILC